MLQKKRGRPATGYDPTLTVRAPAELRRALDAYAADEHLTLSMAIRAILSDWLRTHGYATGDSPKPTGPATEVVNAMDAAIKEHRGSRSARKA